VPGVEIDASRVIDVLTPEQLRTFAMQGPHAARLERVEAFLTGLLGPEPTLLDFGLTGSVGLGLERADGGPPHDWDVVISATTGARNLIVSGLQSRAIEEPQVRVSEYGKSWLVRQWVGRELLCPFFRTASPEVVELFDLDPMPITTKGVVTDASNASLVPVRFSLRNYDGEDVDVILLGLRSRGDIRTGDRVVVEGHACRARTNRSSTRDALVCVADAPQLLITRPWDNFYE